MNERAMRIFEFGEKEQASEEIKKKRVTSFLERGCDRRATGVGEKNELLTLGLSISDKYVFATDDHLLY